MKTLNDYTKESKKLDKSKLDKKIKIALLSNFTIKWFNDVLQSLCYNNKINAEVYIVPYNQYSQEVLNDKSDLYSFNPNLIILILDIKKLLGQKYDFPYKLTPKERKAYIEEIYNNLIALLENLNKKTQAKVVINNFKVPLYSSMGILENKQDFGIVESIKFLNKKLQEYAKKTSQIFVFDFQGFCSKLGYDKVTDKKLDYMADMKISPKLIPRICEEYMAYIIPLLSMTKKCLVLDLDNTVWGGIIGEDGLEGIKLGPEKEGLPYLEFQKKILNLFYRGVILAINSNNNPEDVFKVMKEHPYMLLKEAHFASMRINWNDKVSNMIEIAKEINIGLDSLVFIDDDKRNRELIKNKLPEVTVIEMPEDISLYPEVIDNIKVFNTLNITKDDLHRGKMYAQQRRRQTYLSKATNIDDFLKQLNIKITLYKANSFNIPRIAQLTQKTNQFNMTTKRYLEEDIRKFSKSNNYLVYCVRVEDKFGDNGITGVIIIEKNLKEWLIDTFLLSCRVIGRKIEDVIISKTIEKAKQANAQKLIGSFIPTNKNKPAEDFYKNFGFRLKEQKKEKTIWEFNINKTLPKIIENITITEK